MAYDGVPPISVQRLCRGLSAAKMDEMTQSAGGKKVELFKQVREATRPYGLTGRPFSATAPTFNLTATPHLLLIGDSLLRDISTSLGKVMPGAQLSEVRVWRTGDALAGYNEAVYQNGDMPNGTLNYGRWLEHTKGYRVDGSTFAGSKAQKEFLDVLLGFVQPSARALAWPQRPFDAIFMGGFCLHHMFRQSVTAWSWWDAGRVPGPSGSIYQRHESFIESIATALSCLAQKLEIPFVMVGCSTLDVATLLMDPPKHDWQDFLPFEMVKIWLSAERAVAQRFERSQREQRIPRRSRLFFLEPALLGEACPGVRCDGMHFGSDYASVSTCSSTLQLWHSFLWDYLQSSRLPIGSCMEDTQGRPWLKLKPQSDGVNPADIFRPHPRISLAELDSCLRPVHRY